MFNLDSQSNGSPTFHASVQLFRRSMNGLILLSLGVAITLFCAWPTLAAVELASFTVSPLDNAILLEWQTVDEQQISSFDIFCKNEGEPESAYHLIGNVAAAGGPNQGFGYEFLINQGLVRGESYCFRIEENTTDGSAPEKIDRCGYGLGMTPDHGANASGGNDSTAPKTDGITNTITLTGTPTLVAVDPGTVTPGPTEIPTATPTATLTTTLPLSTTDTLTETTALTSTAIATTVQEIGTPTATPTVMISTPSPTPITPEPPTAIPTATPIGISPLDLPTPTAVAGVSPLDTPGDGSDVVSVDGVTESAGLVDPVVPTPIPTETPTASPMPIDGQTAGNVDLGNVDLDAASGDSSGNGADGQVIAETATDVEAGGEAATGQEDNSSSAYVIVTTTPTPEMVAQLLSPTFTPFPTAMPAPALGVTNVLVPSTQNMMVLLLCLIFFSASSLGILGLVTSVFYMRSSSRSKRK